MAITKKQRAYIENYIYKVMNILDETKTNSKYYKNMFKGMSDSKFEKLVKSDFPYRFHSVPFKVEPKLDNVIEALDYIGVPLLERISLPFKYINKEGKPVMSKECIVIPIHLKKVQQFVTHKNSIAPDIKSRDMKTGLLVFEDKGGKQSDREAESVLAMGLENTAKELSTIRADSMEAKNLAYSQISTMGYLEMDKIPMKQSDSLSKKLMNTYIIGSMGISNLISPSYQTKYTLEQLSKTLKDKEK